MHLFPDITLQQINGLTVWNKRMHCKQCITLYLPQHLLRIHLYLQMKENMIQKVSILFSSAQAMRIAYPSIMA